MPNNIAIHEKLMAVRLNCHYNLQNRITDKAITNETNQAKGTRALLVKKERFPGVSGNYLNALHSTLAKFYQYHSKVTMSSVNVGEALLPVAFYLDYMQEFSVYQSLVDEKLEDFIDNYDLAVLAAQQPAPLGLGPVFNAADYPKKDTLRGLLRFRVITLPLPEADTLLKVVGESVQADVDAYLQEAMNLALEDVNQRVRKALERTVEQLSDPKKKVYDSLQSSLLELVSYIPSFNVVEDDSLTMLAAEIKDKLLVHNTETLRSDVTVRTNVAQQAAEILRRMG